MLSFSALEEPVSRNTKTSENLKLGGANRQLQYHDIQKLQYKSYEYKKWAKKRGIYLTQAETKEEEIVQFSL